MKNTFLIAAALFAFSLMLSCNDNDIDDVAPNNTALDSLGIPTDTLPDTTWIHADTLIVDTVFTDTTDIDTAAALVVQDSRFF